MPTMPSNTLIVLNPVKNTDLKDWSAQATLIERVLNQKPTANTLNHEQFVPKDR